MVANEMAANVLVDEDGRHSCHGNPNAVSHTGHTQRKLTMNLWYLHAERAACDMPHPLFSTSPHLLGDGVEGIDVDCTP